MVHGAQGFFQGGVGIVVVDLVEVEVIRLQSSETEVDLIEDVLAGAPVHVGTIAHVRRHFGGQQDLRTLDAQRFSDEDLRLPFTIGIGGLDEVDAASTAWRRTRSAAGKSRRGPKLLVPRPMTETCKPECPNRRYSIPASTMARFRVDEIESMR